MLVRFGIAGLEVQQNAEIRLCVQVVRLRGYQSRELRNSFFRLIGF
jgi:hypothetical protein